MLGFSTASAWRAGEGTLAQRIGHTAVALAGASFVWQMAYRNVLSV